MDKTRRGARVRLIAAWMAAGLLTLIFVPAGWQKFSDHSGWAVAFRHWGYPTWFRVLIGVMELGGVALLLTGRWAVAGAALIIVVMLGGMTTHVIFDGGRHVTSEVVPLVLASLVVAMRVIGTRRRPTGLEMNPSAS